MATDELTAILNRENIALREALQDLLDEQNGPPLETRKEAWERAYNRAAELLSSAKR